ncbi:MAG: carboxypeptidase-like regulatory domain-containing protein [Acidobacteriia bacterium]|nr:carboxypeptidase-like regulatory domain-containing protein [Terriglobia bacterium]
MTFRRIHTTLLVATISLAALSPLAFPQTNSPDPKTVPVIDGGIGPCSADFLVHDASGAPVYNAKIRVHIAYGFMNARKLDLEVGTNADGKARFEGLPNKLKHGGLNFSASHDDQEGSAFVDPASTCKAQLTITLEKPAAKKPE